MTHDEQAKALKKPKLLVIEPDDMLFRGNMLPLLDPIYDTGRVRDIETARVVLPQSEWSAVIYNPRTPEASGGKATQGEIMRFVTEQLSQFDVPTIVLTRSRDLGLEEKLGRYRLASSTVGKPTPLPYSFLRAPYAQTTLLIDLENAVTFFNAGIDPKTGLLTEKRFKERLYKALDKTVSPERRANPRPVAVVMGDLDGFKKVNDDLGYDKGDLILRIVAEKLKGIRNARVSALSRLQGDEYAILFAENLPHAMEASHQIGQEISSLDYSVYLGGKSGSHDVYISLGAAASSPERSTPEAMLKEAAEMMKLGKRVNKGYRTTGSNCYSVFGRGSDGTVVRI
jgi:diguanylate cyclase (GGDEF)-like protein